MTTYNTIVTSKEINVLDEVVKRCPYECVKLDEGKYGFMDNEKGDVRNYFCDTLGYECSNYEAFDFEYFDEPQTIHKSKPNFYTTNGWKGSKYSCDKGAKEVAKELRAYIRDYSDAMIDYYDCNIYDHYEIGQYDKPFQIIENKGSKKQVEPSSDANEVKPSEPVVISEGLEIVDYSEKAIAVFGETKSIKDELKKLGGKFNPALKYNGEKRAGWIFSKKQADKVRALLAPAAKTEKSETYKDIWRNTKTIIESLKDDLREGRKTIKEASRKLNNAGFLNYVDIDSAARLLNWDINKLPE